MKHKYTHKKTGQLVTVVKVDLIGPEDNREWWLTLSNGHEMTMHYFTAQFDGVEQILMDKAFTEEPGKH